MLPKFAVILLAVILINIKFLFTLLYIMKGFHRKLDVIFIIVFAWEEKKKTQRRDLLACYKRGKMIYGVHFMVKKTFVWNVLAFKNTVIIMSIF